MRTQVTYVRFALLASCVLAVPFLLRPVAFGQGTPPISPEKQHPIDVTLERCIEKNPSTAGMVQCVTQAERAWDKEMNVQYRKLRSSLNPKEQAKLTASQRAWLKYRDAETQTQNAVYGRMQGTMYIPLAAESHCDLTRERAKLLTRYAELDDPI